jgi:putative adenylate-forming enzyme
MTPLRFPLLAAARYLQHRSDHWSEERLRRHQRRRVTRLLDYLRRASPYYRERLPAGRLTLDDVPPMTKAVMMERFDEINTAGLHRDDLVEFRIAQERLGRTDLYPGGYSVGLSSGTSGNKVLTVLSPRERAWYSALLWARSGVPRDLRQPRVLFALRTNNPAFTAVRALGVALWYVDYFVPVRDLVGLINRERLNVLAGPPSLLILLAEERAAIASPLAAVVSYAEELDEPTRHRLGRVFGAPVVEIYQGAEGMLGFTCPQGSLHLSEDLTLVELAPSGDELGDARRVIVTDLYRRTQPFVRYELNDLLEIGGRDCACGSAFRRITRIHGRADSIFLLPGVAGGRVRLMPDYVRRSINQASPDVLEYQAIQLGPEDFEFRLSLAEGADRAAILETITANLAFWAGRAGGIISGLRFTDAAPVRDPASHKLIRVVSHCR